MDNQRTKHTFGQKAKVKIEISFYCFVSLLHLLLLQMVVIYWNRRIFPFCRNNDVSKIVCALIIIQQYEYYILQKNIVFDFLCHFFIEMFDQKINLFASEFSGIPVK